jgi:CDP-diacylglycerol--glycerol-3-phosphate 3-phosphatidyltransferase
VTLPQRQKIAVKKNIPNAITVSRMAFAVMFICRVFAILSSCGAAGYGGAPGASPGALPGVFPGALPNASPGALPGALPDASPDAYLLLCFAAIIFSDIADGHIARKTNCVTAIGAKLDIAADMVYVLGSACAFVYFQKLPVWFPAVLAASFTVFLLTSRLLSRRNGRKFSTVFDTAGKMAANLALILPGVFVFRGILFDYEFVMHAGAFVITGLFCIAFVYRIVVCINIVQAEKAPRGISRKTQGA